LFHFFRFKRAVTKLKHYYFQMVYSNKIKYNNMGLLPTVEKKGTLLQKNEKTPFSENGVMAKW